jgi:hypothetical protein
MTSLWMTQRPCLAMCLLAAIGLLAPRLVLVLMWLINSSFVLQPFSGTSVPNPLLPILGLLFLHHNPRLLLGCGLVRGRVVVQWPVGGVDRFDHRLRADR